MTGFEEACRHLSQDRVMRGIIERHGPCVLVPRRLTPYESLVRAIAHQQLHGKAAESILARFVALGGDGRIPAPEAVLAMRTPAMRRCGFSLAKTRAIRDIARHAVAGVVPTKRACARLTDEALIERLTAIWGVGRWTVEMLLIFTLGRLDVLPADDFGIREGFRIVYGLRKLPLPRQILVHGERWRPYRTIAAWYLWRAVERARDGKV